MEPTIESTPLAAGQDVVINNNPALQVDLDVYRPYLEDEDISEADKDALLATLRSIAISFVMLGYNIHPLQQVIDTQSPCGQDEKNLSAMPLKATDMLSFGGKGLSAKFDLISRKCGKDGNQ